MAGFRYGAWRPDVDDLNGEFAGEALGCLPKSRGWGPWPSLAAISEELGADCRGAYMARTSDGSAVPFAFTEESVFKFAGIGVAWTDVTNTSIGAYSLPVGEYWSADQADNKLYLAQAGDPPQVIDVDSGTECANLGGSPPTARYCKAVGGHLFLMDLTSPFGSIQPTTGRIQAAWSGYRDPAFWTVGQRSCDSWTFPAGGFVMGMTSAETGLVIQQSAVNRFVRVTDRRVWDTAVIEGGQGTNSPHSIIEHQGVAIYYGTDGFVASSPAAFTDEAGIEWVDEWFASNANRGRLGAIIGALDPTRPRFNWLFPTVGNDSDVLDHIIGFDKKLQRWFHGEVPASFLFRASTPGVTLEGLDALGYTLESVPFSLDSPIWQGGAPQLGAFNAAGEMGFFSGLPMEALLRTGRMQLIPGKRGFVNGWRPLTEAVSVAGRILVTERPMTPPQPLPENTVSEDGHIHARASGRFHVFETRIPAGETWTNVMGGDFDSGDVVEDGER